MTLSVLLVCDGNICRSPAAERMIQKAFGGAVRADSAGTSAMVGSAMAAPMAALLRAGGVDDSRFLAKQIVEKHVRTAGLVLGMTREHRAKIVDYCPASVRYAFTLREFTRLLQLIDVGHLPRGDLAVRLAAAVPLAAAQRVRVDQLPEADDIPDPYRRALADYRAAYSAIDRAVESIVASVTHRSHLS